MIFGDYALLAHLIAPPFSQSLAHRSLTGVPDHVKLSSLCLIFLRDRFSKHISLTRISHSLHPLAHSLPLMWLLSVRLAGVNPDHCFNCGWDILSVVFAAVRGLQMVAPLCCMFALALALILALALSSLFAISLRIALCFSLCLLSLCSILSHDFSLSACEHLMWCDVWVWASALQPHTHTLTHTAYHLYLL